MAPRLRIAKSEIVRLLVERNRRFEVQIPALVDVLAERGLEAFAEAWDSAALPGIDDLELALEAAADDAPRAF